MTTPFRIEARSASKSTSSGLEEELQGRLRILSIIWTILALCAVCAIAVPQWSQLMARPLDVILAPPIPGAIFLIGVGSAIVVFMLTPPRRVGMGWLQGFEMAGICSLSTYFVWLGALDFRALSLTMSAIPIDLALAYASMWGLLMVGTSVLLPSTWRHAVVRMGVLVACSFISDILIITTTGHAIPKLGTYVVMKIAFTLTWAALALYGSYRVAIFRRSAEDARKLGQYVLRDQLGAGGMGEVYRAEHQFLRRPCAVKLIRPEQAGDEHTLARFEREVQATATLTHPNTVQIYDYGRADDGTLYYVMEFLPGQSLDVIVEREGAMAPIRVVHILTQLCGALAEAHGQGLVHRDIKPGNVVLGERGGVPDVAKLLDFGLVAPLRIAGDTGSDAATRLTQTGALVGTPEYMSPEQCGGDLAIGAESDVYSLGALGYFLLTGKSPFGDRSPLQMIVAHLHEVPKRVRELRPDISPELDAVIARSLEKTTSERFRSVKEMRAALMSASDGRLP